MEGQFAGIVDGHLLVRRYMAMDVILPYVAWITILAFAMDYALRVLSLRLFPWMQRSDAA